MGIRHSFHMHPDQMMHSAADQQHRAAYPGEARVSLARSESKAMADQLMTADKVRLKSRIGELSKADMLAVEHAIRV